MKTRIWFLLVCVSFVAMAGAAQGRERIRPVVRNKSMKGFIIPQAKFLYWQTNNYVDVFVPQAKAGSKLTLRATGGAARPTTLARRYSIIPQMKKMTLTPLVKDGRSIQKLATQKFSVIKPPRPVLELIVNGKQYNGAAPISKKSNLLVRVKADAGFKTHYPADARYRFDKLDLLVHRSLGAPTKAAAYSGHNKDATKGIKVPLGSKLKQDTPGTKCLIKVNKVYRVNCLGKKIEEKFSERERCLGFIIK